MLIYPQGTTSQIIPVAIKDTSSATGGFKTGLTSTSITAYYSRSDQGNAGSTAITLAVGTRGTYFSGGFIEKDSTNAKGVYELGLPTGVLASGATSVVVTIQDAASNNVAPQQILIMLSDPAKGLGAPTNLDTTISSRMATYTQPTGFLAATFPTGTIANTINITAGTITTATNLTTNNDKTGYSLTQSFPANFASLAITAGGAVTVGTNNDKTGYSLTQTFPANFATLSINGSGQVTYSNTAPPTAATIASTVYTTTMTEAYASLHSVPTLAQILFEMRAILAENAVSGTTVTTNKIDGITTAHTYTMDANPNPTKINTAS